MHMYTNSRAKRNHFHCKIESQMFLFISTHHVGVHPNMYTNITSPYKLHKVE